MFCIHTCQATRTDIPYQLRTRFHRMTLINKTKHLNEADFIIFMWTGPKNMRFLSLPIKFRYTVLE